MIIAVDESGDFSTDLQDRSFFISVHIRQRKTLYKLKKRQFFDWEESLPKKLKNSKGEIKSSSLSDQQLSDFAQRVVCSNKPIGITPFAIRPSHNPESVIAKWRHVHLTGIREGAKEYVEMGKVQPSQRYVEFGHWLKKLSYPQYLKILLLGECLFTAFVNTIGHSVSGGYDESELPRMRFLIDQDFVKSPEQNTFWRELLRNQMYSSSKVQPLPLLDKWRTKGHPFLAKYTRSGKLNFGKLFWNNCAFVSSHEHFEIRIADAVNTIVSRYVNKQECKPAYGMVRQLFLCQGKGTEIILSDFDLDAWRYDPEANPWNPHSREAMNDDL